MSRAEPEHRLIKCSRAVTLAGRGEVKTENKQPGRPGGYRRLPAGGGSGGPALLILGSIVAVGR